MRTLRLSPVVQVTRLVTRFAPDGVFSPKLARHHPSTADAVRHVAVPAAHLTGMTDQPGPDARIPVILTPQEVSDLLHIPPGTLADWRLHGSGPSYIKIGHHVRYDLTTLLAWLDGQRHAWAADSGRRTGQHSICPACGWTGTCPRPNARRRRRSSPTAGPRLYPSGRTRPVGGSGPAPHTGLRRGGADHDLAA
jgi:hypothetical protein